MSSPPRLSTQHVTVMYRTPNGAPLPVLGPISLHIKAGEFVCLVGPSGGGKSTLVRVLAGLQVPTEGGAFLNGSAIRQPSHQVALMFQDANLMPWRTVLDNIALPLELAGIDRRARHAAALKLLPALGLDDFAHAYPSELSGGMAQRAALGRVLIQEPQVLLLDEPFGALDALTREQISLDLLRLWSETHQTVFMVTHNINEAVLLADRVLVMSRRPGIIIADITVPLPRPRSTADTYDSLFIEIAKHVRAAINPVST